MLLHSQMLLEWVSIVFRRSWECMRRKYRREHKRRWWRKIWEKSISDLDWNHPNGLRGPARGNRKGDMPYCLRAPRRQTLNSRASQALSHLIQIVSNYCLKYFRQSDRRFLPSVCNLRVKSLSRRSPQMSRKWTGSHQSYKVMSQVRVRESSLAPWMTPDSQLWPLCPPKRSWSQSSTSWFKSNSMKSPA